MLVLLALTEIFLVVCGQKIPIARSKNVQSVKPSARRAPQAETLTANTDDGLVAGETSPSPSTSSADMTTSVAKMKITTTEDQRTVFKACCGESCSAYSNPLDMINLECCDQTPIRREDMICCEKTMHHRRSGLKFYDKCCGANPYSNSQTCCRGKVHEGPGQTCCGDLAYQPGQAMICCGDVLHNLASRRELAAHAACCGRTVYDARSITSFCCGGQVYKRADNYECCLAAGPDRKYGPSVHSFSGPDFSEQHFLSSHFDGEFIAAGFKAEDQLCCNGVYNLTQYDACCYVFDAKRNLEPKPTPYLTKDKCCTMTGLTSRDTATGQCFS